MLIERFFDPSKPLSELFGEAFFLSTHPVDERLPLVWYEKKYAELMVSLDEVIKEWPASQDHAVVRGYRLEPFKEFPMSKATFEHFRELLQGLRSRMRDFPKK